MAIDEMLVIIVANFPFVVHPKMPIMMPVSNNVNPTNNVISE